MNFRQTEKYLGKVLYTGLKKAAQRTKVDSLKMSYYT